MSEEFNSSNPEENEIVKEPEEKVLKEEKETKKTMPENDFKAETLKKIKALPLKAKLISIAVIVLIIVVLVAIGKIKASLGVNNGNIWGEEGKVTTITETTIREVLEISELQTAEYIYNSIVEVHVDDSDKIKYYVAYMGKVYAGIDFSKIQVNVNNNSKEVRITIPEVYIQDTVVDTDSLDFIFTKDKYDTASTHKEAYIICDNDLKEKAESDTTLLSNAEMNVRNIVEGLLKPWIEELNKEYTVIIE